MDEADLIGLRQVASMLGVHPYVVRRLWQAGRFHPPIHQGPPPLWDRFEVEAWGEMRGYRPS